MQITELPADEIVTITETSQAIIEQPEDIKEKKVEEEEEAEEVIVVEKSVSGQKQKKRVIKEVEEQEIEILKVPNVKLQRK